MFSIGGKKDQAKAAAARAAPRSASKSRPLSNLPKLSMYADAPSADIALEDFELYALDRMRVLKAIDDGMSRGKKPAEMEVLIQEEANKHLKTTDAISGRGADDAALTKDEVSHFALRLAYCRTEELRRWFLLQECALFKHRFGRLDAYAKAAFLEEHDMDYRPISPEEFAEVKSGLEEVLRGIMKRDDADKIMSAGAAGFYSVPFEEVADLVRGRRVFMSAGQAYVPRDPAHFPRRRRLPLAPLKVPRCRVPAMGAARRGRGARAPRTRHHVPLEALPRQREQTARVRRGQRRGRR